MSDKNALAAQTLNITPFKAEAHPAYREMEPKWEVYGIPTYTRITIPTRLNRAKQGVLADVAVELRLLADEIEVLAVAREEKLELLMTRLLNLASLTNNKIKVHTKSRGN